jgi:hypothetical protein
MTIGDECEKKMTIRWAQDYSLFMVPTTPVSVFLVSLPWYPNVLVS